MTLLALVAALMTALSPHAARTRDGRAIAAAIVEAVAHDPSPPVFGSREADAATLVVWAFHESSFRVHAVGHGSWGAFQLASGAGKANAQTQARAALALIHAYARLCPDLPMAGYSSGRCDRGRVLAGRRMNEVARLMERVEREGVAETQR